MTSTTVTRCPACHTLFRVVPDQLRLSQGWVRCGHCGEVFDANVALVAEDELHTLATDERHGDPATATVTPGLAQPADARPAEETARATDSAEAVDKDDEAAAHILSPVAAPAPTDQPERQLDSSSLEEATPESGAESFPPFWDMALSRDRSADAVDATPVSEPQHSDPDIDSEGTFTTEARVQQATELAPLSGSARDQRRSAAEAVAAIDFVVDEPAPAQDSARRSARKRSADPAGAKRARARRAGQRRPDRAAASGSEGAALTPAELSFVRAARRRAFWRRPLVRAALAFAVGWVLVTAAALLALQQRDWLAARYPTARPALNQACALVGCAVRPYRKIEAVVVESSSFDHLGDGRYRLNVSLSNKEDLEIQTPALELTLTDVNEQPVLVRLLQAPDVGARSTLRPREDWTGGLTMALDPAVSARVVRYHVIATYR